MTPVAQWSKNVQFLQSALSNRDRFCFSVHPLSTRRGSFFFHELRFLRGHGVQLNHLLDAFVAS